MIRYNAKTHNYGIDKERKLKPLLEAVVGESLTKTRHLYDIMDFESESFLVELKSRTEQYHPADFTTWLLPTCKGEEAKKNKHKQSLFFYYWAITDELYMIEYDEKLFETFNKSIPTWHKEKQEHYWVPASEFSFVQLQ